MTAIVYSHLQGSNQTVGIIILVVEDDDGIRLMLKDLVAFETPYNAVYATTGAETLEAVREVTPSLFVLNYNLPDTNGIALYDQLHTIQRLATVPALLITARLSDEIADEVNNRNITFVQKPFDITDLLNIIEKTITTQNTPHHA